MAYYHDRSSPGNPPSLYDTSTSTAEDSYSSTSRRHKSTMIQHEPTAYSTPRNRYPRIRKSSSEPVQPTGRYMETSTVPIEDRCDPTALQFMDDFGFDDDHLSSRATFEPVTKARQVYSPTRARQNGSSRNYFGDVRSKFEASRKTSADDPNESFGSSLDTPSTANSFQGLKRQLWTNNDGMQNRRSNQQLPSPRVSLDDTFDSDNNASFKSKYYEAAMRGRDTTYANSEEAIDRTTTSRPRTKSRGEETYTSALSTPSDEGRRSHSARNHRTVLDIPSLQDTSASRHSFSGSQSQQQSPVIASRNQLPNPFEDRGRLSTYEPTRARSLSRTRDRFTTVQESRTRIPASDEQRQLPDPAMSQAQSFRGRDPSVESRGRTQISPLIQHRIRELSQDSRGRSVDRNRQSHRSYSQDSRRHSTAVESSFERLAREFGQELEARPTAKQPTTASPTTHVPHGTQSNLSEPTIRRITTIKDAPSQRSEAIDRRPSTPINSLREAPSLDESKSLEEGPPKQHAEVAAYWQEKARSSPTPPMPHRPLATRSRPMDYQQKPQEAGRSSDSRSNSVERQVADLVAKLSAVNRSNPAQALAQIDSILRQETRINSIDGLGGLRRPPTAFGAPAMTHHADGDSDDESSVSELTNPTFQSASNLRQDEHRNVSQHHANAPQPQNSYVPSTSSFRRPRPSGVQNYIPSHLQQDVSTRHIKEQGRSKAIERRDELNDHLPPSTIKVTEPNDDPSFSSPSSRLQDKIRVTVTHSSDRRTPPTRSPTLEDRVRDTVTRQNEMEMKQQNATSKTRESRNVAIGNKQLLAAKIRDWDEMSNGQKNPTREGSAQRQNMERRASRKSIDQDHNELSQPSPNLPTPTKWNRSHPWDGEIPTRLDKVETRDTSMENADGIEVALPRLSRSDEESDDRLSSSLDVSRSEQQRSAKPKPFTKKVPRDKSLLEVLPDDPALFNNSNFPDIKDLEGKPTRSSQEVRTPVPSRPVPSSQSTPMSPHLPQASNSRTDDARVPFQSGTLFTDASHTPFSPPKAAVNPFATEAMVAMPYDETLPTMKVPAVSTSWSPLMTGDLFPEIPLVPGSDTISGKQNTATRQQPPQQRDGRQRKGPIDTDESFETIHSSQRPGPASCLSVWKSDINRPKDTVERGAIEVAFVVGEDGILNTSADTSTSLEIFGVNQKAANAGTPKSRRRGFLRAFIRKDKKKNDSSVSKSEPQDLDRPTTTSNDSRPVPQIWLQPVLPAYHPDAPLTTGRGRNDGRLDDGAPKRAASVDRFRSQNMARKFGRMMSLYDKD